MALNATMAPDGNSITIRVGGRFDFNLHKDFRSVYKELTNPQIRYVIDMAGTEYMDSSALGMLLLLREFAGGDKADIEIINANPEIQKIFTISNFHRLFDIR